MSIGYSSRGWSDGLTAFDEILFTYNYLDLEEDGFGVDDEGK